MARACVLHAIYLREPGRTASVLREGLMAARALRRLRETASPALGAAFVSVLFTNENAAGALPPGSAPWDERHTIGLEASFRRQLASLAPRRRRAVLARSAPYLFKLSALLRVDAPRALFLDCDLLVLQRSFAAEMLRSVLAVSDVAMPIDPGREPALAERRPPWTTATAGPPPLCSAVIAFRRTNATAALWLGAGARLISAAHPEVRQGDQEAIWFEWTRGSGRGLRVLPLPEEYYCPLERRQAPQRLEAAVWRSSWRNGRYRCRSVHGHAYFAAS